MTVTLAEIPTAQAALVVALAVLRLRGQLTRHSLEVCIRRPCLESAEHPLHCLVGRQSAISETGDDEKRDSQ